MFSAYPASCDGFSSQVTHPCTGLDHRVCLSYHIFFYAVDRLLFFVLDRPLKPRHFPPLSRRPGIVYTWFLDDATFLYYQGMWRLPGIAPKACVEGAREGELWAISVVVTPESSKNNDRNRVQNGESSLYSAQTWSFCIRSSYVACLAVDIYTPSM
jgi:hypothetical protein